MFFLKDLFDPAGRGWTHAVQALNAAVFQGLSCHAHVFASTMLSMVNGSVKLHT